MGDDPIIADSARKHGVSDEDILHAYANPIRVFELDDGLTMIIGRSRRDHLRDRRRRGHYGVGHSPRDESTRQVSEVMMTMPRTVQDILDHAEELAKRFEDYEPTPEGERDPEVYAELRSAVLSRSDAERSIRDAVHRAREHGYSWAFIGTVVGTSGEAARQRYGHKQDA